MYIQCVKDFLFRYLEHAVDEKGVDNKDEAVHNLLVFLYTQHDRSLSRMIILL